MSARQPGPYDKIARKWLALAERRKAAFIEMCESGRWKHYYSTRADVDHAMLELDVVCERWAAIAGLLPQREEPSV